MEDGIRIYWDLAPFHGGNQSTVVLQAGTAYVDMATNLSSEALPPGVSLKVSLNHILGQPANLPSGGDGPAFGEDGYRRVGSILLATRCSARYLECVTGAIPLANVYLMGWPVFALCMALLGLAGGALGFFASLAYFRKGTLEQQLHRAIRKDGLRWVYQPVVDLASGRIVGAEALVRWTDEKGLAVPPEVLIRKAEERGFVGEITRLTVRHVLRDLGALLRSDPGFQVSVNVTAFDLAENGFMPVLEAARRRPAYGLRA